MIRVMGMICRKEILDNIDMATLQGYVEGGEAVRVTFSGLSTWTVDLS